MQRIPIQLLVLFSLIVSWSCQSNKTIPAKADWREGNRRMAAILKHNADKADFFKISELIINDKGVELYREQLKHGDTYNVIAYRQLRKALANQLLMAGRSEDALKELLAIEHDAPAQDVKAVTKELAPWVALSWFRMGEQQNCVDNHNPESCIFPLQGNGVYKEQGPTKTAIKLYLAMLKDDPTDYQSRWMLNIAYQAVGQYPKGVPKAYYIPADHFESGYPMGKFTDIAMQLGLDVHNLAGGVVVEDFNNDGNLDVFMTNEAFDGPTRLFMNDGKGGFVEKTAEAGLEGNVAGRVMATADYDNDGFTDIYICRGAWLSQEDDHWPNSLLHNNGDGTFSDVTEAAGMLTYHPTSSASWADYDNDGFVDLIVTNETKQKAQPHPCQLYHNNGNGTFTEVAVQSGIDVNEFIKNAAWGDYNNDGLMDLYLSNLHGSNILFKNSGAGRDGKVTFSDVTTAARVQGPGMGFPTMFFDYNNDGWPDIFASCFDFDLVAQELPAEYLGIKSSTVGHGMLYLNNHDGTFKDVTEQAKLNRLIFAMNIGWGDIDNDGYPDFYAGTGFLDLRFLFPNLMFRNNEGKDFQDVTIATGTGHLQKGHGIAFADINNDGQQDVFAMLGGAYSGDAFHDALFMNPGNNNHWINLKLEGKKSNRSGIGSRIHVTVATPSGDKEIYTIVGNNGTFGVGSLDRAIGLGQATSIKNIEIVWAGSGTKQELTGVAMDQFYHLQEAEGNAGLTPYPRTKITFPKSDGMPMMHHQM